MQQKPLHFLIAAGGTGGHLFPALAVVNELKKINPAIKFSFTGRVDKIEGRIIPESEHEFLPIDVMGISKKINQDLLKMPFRFYSAYKIIKKYIKANNVNAVICAGAYISYSPGMAASKMNIPLFLLEANVNPGKAIKTLSGRAKKIFTSFEESKDYFEQSIHSKLIYTGNPVRSELLDLPSKSNALEYFGLKENKKTVLIFGGSLGARSINNATLKFIKNLKDDIQVIWQTGKNYKESVSLPDNVKQFVFIDKMDYAYAAADLVISRSGATTVAELEVTGKPSILVPLPSASTNEQYHNAKVLEINNASLIIKDEGLENELTDNILRIINNDELLLKMSNKAKKMAKPNAAQVAAENILNNL